MAGQSVGALAMSNPMAGFREKAGAAIGGFGSGFAPSAPHMLQNMALMGTVGTLGGLGASRSASAINRAIELKMPEETTQTIQLHRAGMLTKEFNLNTRNGPLPETGWNNLFNRAFSVGVPHDAIRAKFDLAGGDLDQFRLDVDQLVASHAGR